MKPIRLLVSFGTRPEAIKLAPLILLAKSRSDFEVLVCNTAQHREMSDGVLNLFGIKADFDLNLMRPGQTINDVTIGVLNGLSPALKQSKPDWVIVQGDTTTAFVSALAAFYEKVSVAHVEAGLRTQDIYSPFPEEMNRRLVTQIASMHFPPTTMNHANLVREGVDVSRIMTTGNTGIDALQLIVQRLTTESDLRSAADNELAAAGIPRTILESDQRIVLLTCHRRENFGDGLASIFEAMKQLAQTYPDRQFIFPAHPNPLVRQAVASSLGGDALPNFHVIEPLPYLPFIRLMSRSEVIVTDSGGIQEEAPSLGKRVVVVRESTERAEGLSSGLVRMSGTDRAAILRDASAALNGDWVVEKATDLYGDGNASARILDALLQHREYSKCA